MYATARCMAAPGVVTPACRMAHARLALRYHLLRVASSPLAVARGVAMAAHPLRAWIVQTFLKQEIAVCRLLIAHGVAFLAFLRRLVPHVKA
jgi:hypothetical protein